MIETDILGDFPGQDLTAKVVCIFGERLKQRNHFEPRGDAETAGMRIPGTTAAEPALREGLAEA